MMLSVVELPRQSRKQHQSNKQAGVHWIIEETGAARLQAGPQRLGGVWGETAGLSHLIAGLAPKAPPWLQLLCLNCRFPRAFEAGLLGISLRMKSIFFFFETTKLIHLEPGRRPR